ncbi:MAG: hypothetical protein COU63_03850 [Candidatus Pacebacteria bacterium CG10_big_fil_rev_8_21_14_0_10_36_11]|nr:DUF1704 domain-containing protein [Candidatus Pacearchaeota archaeon]OIP74134.1 MAG: hypothetical protein AUK08_02685 [Candidatus Pacebacteria bacterium CG2_30_36_39]PIR64504.1 MAG: hypothetical protein COU63_03850 [Candidatus Pacebacteria bacterium CG10_big_fil_rev_8_21_14_0_10_36_11]PJC43197.1 MAG: hypothetical protein CO040_00400 [Candidatus Pacebacteria bacterium CG_4_9_14_0_2_um_filter_36_8]
MGLVADLQPTNFLAEKQRFLASPNFNPQFNYYRFFATEDLVQNGLPNTKYIDLAEKIIETTFTKFSIEELQSQRGELLNEEIVSREIRNFLKLHGLERKFEIIWSAEFVSRAAINANEIKLRLPCSIYKEDLDSLLYHEIGTHALRRINYEQQPWFKKKKNYGFAPYLKTEEGLAVLHAMYPQKMQLTYMAALNFLATIKAQEESFLEVWQYLNHYLGDAERAFTLTFKKKRGLTDTSRPGGFTKDYVYFEGFVETTKFMVENNFPLKELYYGKISWQDITKAVVLNPKFQPILPRFYTKDPDAYKRKVAEIAKENFLV